MQTGFDDGDLRISARQARMYVLNASGKDVPFAALQVCVLSHCCCACSHIITAWCCLTITALLVISSFFQRTMTYHTVVVHVLLYNHCAAFLSAMVRVTQQIVLHQLQTLSPKQRTYTHTPTNCIDFCSTLWGSAIMEAG